MSQILDGDDNVLVTYTYDTAGRPNAAVRANGLSTQYDVRGTSNTSQTLHRKADNSVLYDFVYSYDALGHVVGRSEGADNDTFEHDVLGQILSASCSTGLVQEFQYDASSNRVMHERNDVSTSYSVNRMNQYESVGANGLSYDSDGNLTSAVVDGKSWIYHYDSLNRLVRAETTGDLLTFEYDAIGNRSASVHNGVRTEYLYDPFATNRLVAEYVDGSLKANYYHGIGLLARVPAGGDEQYYLFDGDGNVVSLTCSDGSEINTHNWGLFGEVLNQSVSVDQPFGFGGRYGLMHDPTGLIKAGARYMLPELGRFITRDPSKLPVGNLYAYGGNNSLGRLDVSGLDGSSTGQNFLQAVSGFSGVTGTGLDILGVVGNRVANNLIQSGINYAAHAAGSGGIMAQISSASQFQTAQNVGQATQTMSNIGAGLNIVGAWADFGNSFYGENGIHNRIIQGDPYANADAVRAGGKLILKTAFAEVPFSGLVIDGTEYVVDQGSQSIFQAGWDAYYAWNQPRGRDLWGDRFFQDETEFPLEVRRSFDPNEKDKSGKGPNGGIEPGDEIIFGILFENLETADLAAQEVTITDTLSSDLDWDTLELVDIEFNDASVAFPEGLREVRTFTTVSTDPNPVDIEITFDDETGLMTTLLRSVNELTGEPPLDPIAGFLPPNDESGRGEGKVRFRIRANDDLVNGDTITNQATIVFDVNEPIVTNETSNVVDTEAPTSSVVPLTGDQFQRFIVEMAGNDNGGSGVASYDIFVSIDGGQFELWLDNHPADTAFYDGEVGVTYAFYSVATDYMGLVESKAPGAEMTVTPNLAGLTFSKWQEDNFDAADLADIFLEDSIWGRFADPDLDGIPNYVEYAMALDPNFPDSAEVVDTFYDAEGKLSITYRISKDRFFTDVPEQSSNLGFWTEDGITREVLEDNVDHFLVKATVQVTDEDSFLRVRITD